MNHPTYIKACAVALLCCGLAACQQEMPTYETEECNLNFYYGSEGSSTTTVKDEMRRISHSFILDSKTDATEDTVWVTVKSMGYLSDEDRPIAFQQFATEGNDAVPGEHYVAFDDPALQARYYMPANKATVKLPIVVKRAASLANEDVMLKFGFQANDYFQVGYPEFSYYELTISDRLSKPSLWDVCNVKKYLGEYGAVKHQLLIEWTGKDWDDTYLKTLYYSNGSYWSAKDSNYLTFLGKWAQKRLDEENAKRLADPAIGDVWRENDEKRTEIKFQ